MQLRLRRMPYYLQSLFGVVKAIDLRSFSTFVYDFLQNKKLKTVKLKKHNLIFKLSTYLDILTLKEVVLDEEYESQGIKVEGKDKIIIDIGAGFGDFSILAAKKFPKAKIFAFEPDPFYFKLLQENIRLNKVKNVTPYQIAITSLKQVSHLISSLRIDFLKIDCEGCEFRIINERNTNLLRRINKISLEYHENDKSTVIKLVRILENDNFMVRIIPRRDVKSIGLLYAKR